MGLPVAGEDFTDIPVEIQVSVKSLPTTVENIEVLMVENSKGCSAKDGSIGKTSIMLRNGTAEHPNKYEVIENPVESTTYDIEMNVDPGIYCLMIQVNGVEAGSSGINVDAEVDMYPTQLPFSNLCSDEFVDVWFCFHRCTKDMVNSSRASLSQNLNQVSKMQCFLRLQRLELPQDRPASYWSQRARQQVQRQVQQAHHLLLAQQVLLQLLAQQVHQSNRMWFLNRLWKQLRPSHLQQNRLLPVMCMKTKAVAGISEKTSQMEPMTRKCMS